MRSVLAISGSNEFLRDRNVNKVVEKHKAKGWGIQTCSGEDHSMIESVVRYPNADFFGQAGPTLLVISESAEKSPLPTIEAHAASELSSTLVLLVIDGEPKGNSKFGKFVQGLDKKSHLSFPNHDKPWEMPEILSQFCVDEARGHKAQLTPELASILVKVSNPDWGFLAFEVQKISMLALSKGRETITAEDIKGGMAPIGEASFEDVRDGLIARNPTMILRAMARVKKSHRDPVMPMCGYIEALALGSRASKGGKSSFGWLHLSKMVKDGMDPDSISAALGSHPWRTKNILIPEVRKWTPEGVLKLIQITSSTRRAVLSGHTNPWTYMLSELARLTI